MPIAGPTPTELQFDYAIQQGISPFNWIPPESPPKSATVSQRSGYDKTVLQREAACQLLEQGGFEQHADADHIGKKEDHLPHIPHPRSKFEHVDPAPEDEKALLKLPLDQVESYRRLDRAFQWMVCRISSHLADLNVGIRKYNQADPASGDDYRAARLKYMAFLKNLNIHDPQGNEVNPQEALGYGRNLHWTFVDPVIEWDAGNYVITGVTIVAEWNPHVSSSGVPIAH